jgi:hypothetical protein
MQHDPDDALLDEDFDALDPRDLPIPHRADDGDDR